MPLTPKAGAFNAQVHFALEGATLTDGGNVIQAAGDVTVYTTVQRGAKPSDADGAWVRLSGVMKTEMLNDNGQVQEVWENIPDVGTELYEQFRVGRKRSFKITCQRKQPLTVQLLLQTLALNGSSGQFNPGENLAEVNGWLNIDIYNHAGTRIWTLDQWVELVLENGLTLDPKTKTDPVYNATGLYSPLNTGTLSPA
jgi:hypothetical protein